MIKRIKLFFQNVKNFCANYSKMSNKEKSTSIMLIIYFIFFTIILIFPLLLIREFTLYTMQTYEIGNIAKTNLVITIVMDIAYFFIAINYFTNAFNKKFGK